MNQEIKSTDKIDFDHTTMVNGPSIFIGHLAKGEVRIKVRTGNCENWNRSEKNLVSINLCEHDIGHVDAYVFCIDPRSEQKEGKTIILLGWIFFDELLDTGQSMIDEEGIYIAIPIEKLRPMETIKEGF
jgi:hypothetical protein